MLVRVRSSKKAAIYDGCNRNSISRSCSRDAPQRRQPSTTAATLGQALDQARHSLLKEGSHLRRLQLTALVAFVLISESSKKAAIYDGCNTRSATEQLRDALSSKKAAIYDGCNEIGR